MIERLLEAERARTAGELDLAATLLSQVIEADPRNAIAVVGLARVALDRGDLAAAETLARRAREIDPEEAAAARILAELAERAEPAAEPGPEPGPEPEPAVGPEPVPALSPAPPGRGWLRRLLDRLFGRRDLPS
jgi:tetratricopeptide (TPR) repeat protein